LFERSEFEQVPKACEQNRGKYPISDGSGSVAAALPRRMWATFADQLLRHRLASPA
jgi:hypothetical protein